SFISVGRLIPSIDAAVVVVISSGRVPTVTDPPRAITRATLASTPASSSGIALARSSSATAAACADSRSDTVNVTRSSTADIGKPPVSSPQLPPTTQNLRTFTYKCNSDANPTTTGLPGGVCTGVDTEHGR